MQQMTDSVIEATAEQGKGVDVVGRAAAAAALVADENLAATQQLGAVAAQLRLDSDSFSALAARYRLE
jgi:methyl-accepting chemotaxis protein